MDIPDYSGLAKQLKNLGDFHTAVFCWDGNNSAKIAVQHIREALKKSNSECEISKVELNRITYNGTPIENRRQNKAQITFTKICQK